MTKQMLYQSLNAQLCALLENEDYDIASMANMSALLYHALDQVNWVGFYLFRNNELILGPFQGNVACMHIEIGKGVCGTCATTHHIQRIEDVHAFPGHIACDVASKSEIVIPIYRKGNFFGVLDIDAPIPSRFDEDDEVGLSLCVNTLEQHI